MNIDHPQSIPIDPETQAKALEPLSGADPATSTEFEQIIQMLLSEVPGLQSA